MTTESPTVGDLYNLMAYPQRRLVDTHRSTLPASHSPIRTASPPSDEEPQLPAPVLPLPPSGCRPCELPFGVAAYHQSQLDNGAQHDAYEQAECLREIEDEIRDFIPKLRELDDIKYIIMRNLEETQCNMLQRIKFLQLDFRDFRDEYYEIENDMDEEEEEELWDKVEGGATDVDELEEELEKDFNENVERLRQNREEYMEIWNLGLDTVDWAHGLLGDH